MSGLLGSGYCGARLFETATLVVSMVTKDWPLGSGICDRGRATHPALVGTSSLELAYYYTGVARMEQRDYEGAAQAKADRLRLEEEYPEAVAEVDPRDEDGGSSSDSGGSGGDGGGENDELFQDAVRIVLEYGKASTSLLQRRLRIGYGRAAHLIDLMEQDGIVGAADGPKPREVLKRPDWLSEVEQSLR